MAPTVEKACVTKTVRAPMRAAAAAASQPAWPPPTTSTSYLPVLIACFCTIIRQSAARLHQPREENAGNVSRETFRPVSTPKRRELGLGKGRETFVRRWGRRTPVRAHRCLPEGEPPLPNRIWNCRGASRRGPVSRRSVEAQVARNPNLGGRSRPPCHRRAADQKSRQDHGEHRSAQYDLSAKLSSPRHLRTPSSFFRRLEAFVRRGVTGPHRVHPALPHNELHG